MSGPFYALAVNVHRRDTGRLVSQRLFLPSEVEFPGMVESFKRQYDGTDWHTVAVPLMTSAEIDRWLNEIDPPEQPVPHAGDGEGRA